MVPEGADGKYPAEALTLSAQGTRGSWYYIEDHRQHTDEQGVKQGGTEYWLPSAGDTWLSSPRFMEELGPLPDGFVTVRPEKPAKVKLSEARSESERRFAGRIHGDRRAQGSPSLRCSAGRIRTGNRGPFDRRGGFTARSRCRYPVAA